MLLLHDVDDLEPVVPSNLSCLLAAPVSSLRSFACFLTSSNEHPSRVPSNTSYLCACFRIIVSDAEAAPIAVNYTPFSLGT